MVRILNRKAELLAEQEEIKKSAEDEALRTLEEELADLEELWPLKPYELKKSIVAILIKRVVIDQMSTKFFRVMVEWKYKEWGLEQTYLSHNEGGRKEWTEEEIALLQRVYRYHGLQQWLLAFRRGHVRDTVRQAARLVGNPALLALRLVTGRFKVSHIAYLAQPGYCIREGLY